MYILNVYDTNHVGETIKTLTETYDDPVKVFEKYVEMKKERPQSFIQVLDENGLVIGTLNESENVF
jgi:hypothetical protein